MSRIPPLKFPTPAQGSLFSLLVRAPFWVSLLVAGALFLVARNFLPVMFAVAVPLPFIGTAFFAGWRQYNTPSPTRVNDTLDRLREMQWLPFAALVAEGFRREGYQVGELDTGVANYELTKSGYTTLVSCKRWRVAQTGVAPLRELHEAMATRGARDCVYVTAGTFTDIAEAFAREKKIRLLSGADLSRTAGPLLEGKAHNAAGR